MSAPIYKGGKPYFGSALRVPKGIETGAVVLTSAAFSSATNKTYLKYTLTPTTTVTATSGFSALKGEVNLSSGKSISGTSFVTALNGRQNIFGTVDIGSGDLAAVYAKQDLNGSTLTSGHIAPLQSNIVNPPASALTTVDLVYVESAGGNPINSYLRAFGKATYVFDLESNVHTNMSTSGTPGSVTGATGWLKINVNGTTRYIPLASSVS